jgi:rhodanese-related sulfurtransferase
MRQNDPKIIGRIFTGKLSTVNAALIWCKWIFMRHFGARCTEKGKTPSSGAASYHTPQRNLGNNAMTNIDEILTQARARAPGQPYAGAVTPQEAWSLLQADPRVKLVDVRTNAERDWVGRVAIAEGQHGAVQWSTWPGGVPNPDFVQQLEQVAGKDQVLLFLCRSGVRSRHAAKAATESGYANSFDILEGFEGDKDAEGHRKSVGGWCKAGLPWVGA